MASDVLPEKEIGQSLAEGYSSSMTTEEIKRLPTEEKFLMMETLWDDLREHYEQAEIPESHQDLLRSRRQRVQSGESKLLDWDDVKSSIGRP